MPCGPSSKPTLSSLAMTWDALATWHGKKLGQLPSCSIELDLDGLISTLICSHVNPAPGPGSCRGAAGPAGAGRPSRRSEGGLRQGGSRPHKDALAPLEEE